MRKTFIASAALAAAALVAATGCDLENTAAPVQSADSDSASKAAGSTETPPVKLEAKVVEHKPAPYTSGGPYSCVQITITNNTEGQVESNPMFFAITDADGTKRTTSALVDDREINAVTLAPGENAKGVICAEGEFTPDVVAFDDFTHQARAQVAR